MRVAFDGEVYALKLPRLKFKSEALQSKLEELLESLKALISSFKSNPTFDRFKALRWLDQFGLMELGRFDLCDSVPPDRKPIERSVRAARNDVRGTKIKDSEWLSLSDSSPGLGCLIDGRKAQNGRARNAYRASKPKSEVSKKAD